MAQNSAIQQELTELFSPTFSGLMTVADVQQTAGDTFRYDVTFSRLTEEEVRRLAKMVNPMGNGYPRGYPMSTPLPYDVVQFEEVPPNFKIGQKYESFYRTAVALPSIKGVMKIKIEGFDPQIARKKMHVYFRRKTMRLRTRVSDGYLYLWLDKPYERHA